jgi:hypothetical protein
MLVRGAAAGFSERDGDLLSGSWAPILDELNWRKVRELLTDPARNTRTFAQRSRQYPLSGLLFCGLCGQRLSASIMRYGLTYWCPEGPGGGCGHVRIRGADTERYLLELVTEHVRAHPGPAADAEPVLGALRAQLHELQDDHYDRLLDRADFLRRLQQRIADRRRGLTLDAGLATGSPPGVRVEDTEPLRRAYLRQHLEQVTVGRHPPGSTRPPQGWTDRAAGLGRRLHVQWHDDTAPPASVRGRSQHSRLPSTHPRPTPALADARLAATGRWN